MPLPSFVRSVFHPLLPALRGWLRQRTLPWGCGTTVALALVVATGQAAQARETEMSVMHWWVSQGERASMAQIRNHTQARGILWKEEAVPGSGTAKFTDVLEARVRAGQAPAAAQMLGYDIQNWAQRGLLDNLDALAAQQEWNEVVPADIQRLSKWRGQWVAAPFTAHSTNWLWVNKAVAERLGITAPPDSWNDLLLMLDKARAQGVMPLAMGSAAWEQALLFESVAVGVGGAEFYRKAFMDLDPHALSSDTLHLVFTRMRQLAGYLEPAARHRRWEQATDMVSSGQALLQVQGSWVGGEFTAKGMVPGRHYHCWRFPDTQGVYLFDADHFVFFKQPQHRAAQQAFAAALMTPTLQASVNMHSGAAPARIDVRSATFNECGQRNITDLRRANLRRTLLGSIAMGSANPPEIRVAITGIVSRHWQGKIDTDAAITGLRQLLVQRLAMQTRSH
jgi:glucose/mannose transport system substrate-binding protein